VVSEQHLCQDGDRIFIADATCRERRSLAHLGIRISQKGFQ
jgi:hypothetical protein